MGANESTYENSSSHNVKSSNVHAASSPPKNSNVHAASTPPKITPRIIEFHSSARWKAHFEASKGTAKLMVIDFTATWCGPCRQMEPTINELAAKYTDVEFIKIDVDELDDVARSFGVVTVPTFLLIKNGKVVDKVVGAKKDEFQKKVELYRF